MNRAADYGIPARDVVVDPLVMPIGAMGTAGRQVFQLVRRLRAELGVNTTCGASNVSFGLPARHMITGTFLSMAMGAGLTSAIMNPHAPRGEERGDGRGRPGRERPGTAPPGSLSTATPTRSA